MIIPMKDCKYKGENFKFRVTSQVSLGQDGALEYYTLILVVWLWVPMIAPYT